MTVSAAIRVLLIVVAVAGLVAALFAIAGRWNWIEGWITIAALTLGNGASDLIVARRDPELFRRRSSAGAGTPAWDKACLTIFSLCYLAMLIVGALDSGRWQLSAMPLWLPLAGAALFFAGEAVITWSMLVNTFFEKTARIQPDRGQRVIDSGPYRFVRHPGYLGTIAGFILAAPLMLGSWWAFVPALIAVTNLVVRTALEDRMLTNELDGYRDYAERVRYRLVPGVW